MSVREGNDETMSLIIVERSKNLTYRRLADKFADDVNVKVIVDRRAEQRRQAECEADQERRFRSDRRRLVKRWNGRDYVVINLVTDHPTRDGKKMN
jgi:hypothetical protein